MRKIAIFTSTLLLLLLAMESIAEVEKVIHTVNISIVEVHSSGPKTFEVTEMWELKTNVYTCKISTMKKVENDNKFIDKIEKINDFKNGIFRVWCEIPKISGSAPYVVPFFNAPTYFVNETLASLVDL